MDKLRTAARPPARNENIAVGLHVLSEFNQAIRYADTKAAALAAAQALAVTVLASVPFPARHRAWTAPLFVLVVAGIVASTALLTAGQRPRLVMPPADDHPNRLAFPSVVRMSHAQLLAAPTTRAQAEDVWRQAAVLAAIAMAKYRWLHRATIATSATVTLMLTWLCLTAWA